MVKACAIIQARMGALRLPNKVLLPLCDKPMLYHIVERLRQCNTLDKIILATSSSPNDDVLETKAKELDIDCLRGPEDDVLARFYLASQNQSKHIVRICADRPFIDSKIVDETVRFYFQTGADIVKIINMPTGLDTEVFSYTSLEQAYNNAKEPYQREHVTPYIYENFITKVMPITPDTSGYRLTLDTEEDYEAISKLYEILYKGKHDFYLDDVIRVLKENPDIVLINQHIKQQEVPTKIREDDQTS